MAVEAGRRLPEEYDEDYFGEEDADERVALCKAYIKARGLGSYATVDQLKPLMVGLPVPVLRDIVAADARRRPDVRETVASTFARAARLLEDARVAAMDRLGRTSNDITRPGEVLGEADSAFVAAICEDVASAGGELLLPPVPALPDWVGDERRAFARVFGWLRLAVGDTNGDRLHSPGCPLVRSRPLLLTDHLPWWLVMLDRPRLCGRCGGPAVRDLVPLAGFVAAADVWHDRGRNRIERWQLAAFHRQLSATTAARALVPEPDITSTWRIVSTLAGEAPGENGWAAYAVVAPPLAKRLEQLTPVDRDAAIELARERLTALEEVLPLAQRPEPLPSVAGVRELHQRHRYLRELLDGSVPQLDRLLFTLPGAY